MEGNKALYFIRFMQADVREHCSYNNLIEFIFQLMVRNHFYVMLTPLIAKDFFFISIEKHNIK